MDKTELLMNLKNETLSTEIEYYLGIWNIKKKILKVFQNIVAIFKINSIDFMFFSFLYVGLLGFVVVDYQFRVRLSRCFQLEFFETWI